MSDTVFITCMAILIPALFLAARMIADVFREGDRRMGAAMIAAMAVIVAAAMPWYLL